METGNTDILLQLGVGGTFAIMILRTVFDFVGKYRTKKDGNGQRGLSPIQCTECHTLVKSLHKMHDVKDEDNVYVWYVRRSLERSIDKLSDNVSTQTAILTQLLSYVIKLKRN